MIPLAVPAGLFERLVIGRHLSDTKGYNQPGPVQSYANLSGRSGITQYQNKDDGSIDISFGGQMYNYPVGTFSPYQVDHLKKLAQMGIGANRFINKNMRLRR
jgi:hypothetical protein